MYKRLVLFLLHFLPGFSFLYLKEEATKLKKQEQATVKRNYTSPVVRPGVILR